MKKNIKVLKELKQFIGTFILLSFVWSIDSFVRTHSLLLNPVAIVFGLQAYFIYIIARDKNRIFQRIILCFLVSYLGISLLDLLNIQSIVINNYLYVLFLILGIGTYIYLQRKIN
ncbi:hypothetical protein A5804_002879 [Enterococcus faecium]|uniref:Uncharacterized protein n=1 Tax=Enterococcus faecium TaxID=1352 RepID=A0AB73ND88_ENTFC|nr:hypothetical protein D352_00066 [Enterococcus faecium LA4B-2]OTN94205.1 hypothetical protein A5804_002879 [Enterococcus faecium]PQE57169.1 hypothetical protein CUS10_14525 [Enterococcus faecium]